MKNYNSLAFLCCGLLATTVNAQTIEGFEYATDEDLLAALTPSANATISLSPSVAPRSTGTNSMRVDFNFPSTGWATETIHGVPLQNLLSIAPTQYLTLRIKGDPAFAASDFRYFYLYAYDQDGNFGRWGTPVPITADWQVLNFRASSIEKPWDSPNLPDQSRIKRLSFFQYGSQAAIDPYTATIYIDDVMVRNNPLTEFPMPAAPRELIDDFEGYADDAALRAFYTYYNSPAATVTTASLETPAPQGNKALKLGIEFAPGQYPWGSVRSAKVAPFSLPTNSVVTVRLKGDPTLAPIADAGTTFWLTFYDNAGGRIIYSTSRDPVISGEWTTLEARIQDFGDTSTVDIGNLVQWGILVEGWEGTAESTSLTNAFYVDDIRIAVASPQVPPSLTIYQDGSSYKIGMNGLTTGATYELKTTGDFSQWTTATTINATSSSATWTVPISSQQAFYRLVQMP